MFMPLLSVRRQRSRGVSGHGSVHARRQRLVLSFSSPTGAALECVSCVSLHGTGSAVCLWLALHVGRGHLQAPRAVRPPAHHPSPMEFYTYQVFAPHRGDA